MPTEFGFDDATQPPKLVNTGTDYVAILKSVAAYGNWLAAHKPDPALLSNFVARGTKVYDLYSRDLTRLRDNRVRGIEILGRPSQYTILSATPDAFSANVLEDIRVHKTVDARGRTTSEVRYDTPTMYLDVLVLTDGHWHLAALEKQHSVNVHL